MSHGIRTIGLTGGIGSGKSTVSALLVGHGATLVDTDAIAHALTAPHGAAMPAIPSAFQYFELPPGVTETQLQDVIYPLPPLYSENIKISPQRVVGEWWTVDTVASASNIQSFCYQLVVQLWAELGKRQSHALQMRWSGFKYCRMRHAENSRIKNECL